MALQTTSVPAAFEQVTGSRPHPTTCWRYATKGVGGVQLKTIVVGGRRLTTEDWVRDFIERRTSQVTPCVDQSTIKKQLDKELGISR